MSLHKRVEKLERISTTRGLRMLSDEQLIAQATGSLADFIENPAEIDRLGPGDQDLVRRFVGLHSLDREGISVFRG